MYPAMVSAAVGLVLFATAGQHAHYFPQIFFAFLLMGAGAGASFVPLLQIGMSEIPNVDAGLGSGIVNVSQQMAGAIGLAALSTIAANDSKSLLASGHNLVSALTHGYQLALLIAAGCVALGLVLTPIVLRSKESPEEQQAHIRENMANPESMEHLVI
jgi:MFS family permease